MARFTRKRLVRTFFLLGILTFGFFLIDDRAQSTQEPVVPRTVMCDSSEKRQQQGIGALRDIVVRHFFKMPTENLNTQKVNVSGICEKHIKKRQDPYRRKTPMRINHVIVVDKLKLLFCYVPKVACTNWKRLLLILQGNLEVNKRVSHMEVHQFADNYLKLLPNLQAVRERYANYTKVMFVREPFARIVSAYRDKLEEPGRVDSDRFRGYWSGRMRNRSVGDPSRREHDISFTEFTSYLANPSNPLDIGEEEHWRPISNICSPCSIKYDFIGKFENLEHDTEHVLTEMLQVKRAPNLLNSTNFTNSSDASILQKYFSGLTPAILNGLHKRYQLDFELFGYPPPTYFCPN